MPPLARKHRGRISALLGLLVCIVLLVGGNGSAPAAGLVSTTVYLPLVRSTGQAQISANLELISKTIVGSGDRLRINVHVRNDGNGPTNSNTAISLPFDRNALRYFTEDIDTGRGDRFVGIIGGREVRLEVGRVDPGTSATVSVWFTVRDGVASGTQISLRASYTYTGQSRTTNRVRVYVTPPGTVPGSCAAFNGTNGRMTVSPDTGAVGTIFLFESDCFDPGETVVAWLNTPTGVEPLDLRATADERGHASFRLNSLGFTPATNYGFVALGQHSRIQVLGPFIVTAGALAAADATVAPAVAPTTQADREPEPAQELSASPAAAVDGLHGVVTGDGGVPLADVLIFVNNAFNGPEAAGTTDAAGGYSFGSLPPGAYTVIFMTDQTSDATSALYARTQRTVTVTQGQSSALDVQLTRGGRIRGVVTGAGNVPLPGVLVFVRDGQNIIGTTTTDAAGIYTTAAFATGAYNLEFNPYSSDFLEATAYLDKVVSNIPITAPNVTDNTNVTLSLDPEIRKFAGRVTDQDTGAALPNVLVTVVDNATSQIADAMISGPDGSYQTIDLPVGSYRITLLTLLTDDPVTRTYVGADYGSVIDMTGPGIRSGIDIALARGAQVTGRVTAANTGAPLAGVIITAVKVPSKKPIALGLTDADGNYSTSGLRPGTFQIVFRPDLSTSFPAAVYQLDRSANVIVSGTSLVTGVNAQLIVDPSKVKYIALLGRQ